MTNATVCSEFTGLLLLGLLLFASLLSLWFPLHTSRSHLTANAHSSKLHWNSGSIYDLGITFQNCTGFEPKPNLAVH